MLYFTADTHFDCENLRKHTRAEFSTIEEHNEAILEGINSTVDRRDQLVILGDFVLKKPGRWRPKIRCSHITYILGNHCNEAKTRAVFGGLVYAQRLVKGMRGNRYFCSHYPCFFWPQSHFGFTSLYGHLHYNFEHEQRMDAAFPDRRSMDVGVDAAKARLGEYRPFSEDEVVYALRDAKGHEELWRDIPGTEGNYQVSTLGNVKSIAHKESYVRGGKTFSRWRKGTLLKPSSDTEGYQVLTIVKDGERKTRKVHRLVLEAFKGESDSQVLHGPGGKANNSLANLCYGSWQENWEDRYRDGTDLCKPVRRSDGKEYLSQTAAALDVGCLSGGISNVCYGKTKNAGGWGWAFA